MEMFKRVESPFVKQAGMIPLGDNNTTWGSELLAALYKQNPYLGTFDVNLQVDGQDLTLGYMYGSFVVRGAMRPAVQAPSSNTMNPGQVDKASDPNEPTVRIPVILKAGKAFSFDVYLDKEGKFHPLTEDRINASLFNASSYTPAPPPETDLAGQGQDFNPDLPQSAAGYGAGYPSHGTYSKEASVLDSVLTTLSADERKDFVKSAYADLWLRQQMSLNKSFGDAMLKIASVEVTVAKAPTDVASVCVVEKVAGGFTITTANLNNGSFLDVVRIENAEAGELPDDMRNEAISKGIAMIVSTDTIEVVKTASIDAKDIVTVTKTGKYKLAEKNGDFAAGIVFADVVSLDGEKLDYVISVAPSGAAVQEKVAGAFLGELDTSVFSDSVPRGAGAFLLPNGSITEPLTIKNAFYRTDIGEQPEFTYTSSMGVNGKLKIANVKKITKVAGYDYMLPADVRFIPLTFGAGVVEDAYKVQKIASIIDIANKVDVISDQYGYTIRGGCGLEKLSSAITTNVSKSMAYTVLGSLGMNQTEAGELVKSASAKGSATFTGRRDVQPFGTRVKTAMPNADVEFIKSLRVDLTKEAASLASTDKETVDSVLSLNFITPDNIDGYIEHLPDFEESLNTLSELLVGVRLGLPDVQESAVLSSLKGMAKVVEGLNLLQMRQQQPEAQPVQQ